jgi:hypothetical protein
MDPVTQTTHLMPPSEADTLDAREKRGKIYEKKSFTFDKSFWSHEESDPHYAHQEDVYRSFGEEFLDHNFEGYHTCIFAYGQTGSGKSYTMMGTPEQPGLIPRTCEELFARIEDDPSPNTNYIVHVSYFEVYNEHVRDLLVPRSNPPMYLKIRESQTEGVYVQGLTERAVKSFADVENLMRVGDVNRTTASTKMNDTSSRSHAVFTIQLKQITHSLLSDSTIERTARMRLVDLAGSERAKATEATGQRLKEGGQINKSLTTLGRVIAALADPRRQPGPNGRRPKDVVPYRDSVLTWLLKDSLGGNSKTAMVACISPTDYDETLSTLRYADQAKRIRTRATVNQDSLSSAQRDAQIKEMAEQIRLLQLNLNAASTRKREREREEATELEDYQKKVEVMQRLMEETREVSDAKIRALTNELEELRPQAAALRSEVEALRRHLGLALEELKNPIVLPPSLVNTPEKNASEKRDSKNADGSRNIEGDGDFSSDSKENRLRRISLESDSGFSSGDDEDDDEFGAELAAELQEQANEFLKDLGMLRKKIGDDHSRFGNPRGDVMLRMPMGEIDANF